MACLNKKSFIKICFTLILLWTFINFAGHTTIASEKGAYIKEFNHKLKIYPQTPDMWNLTVYNVKYEESEQGEAWFSFKFYIDGKLWLDEYNSTEYKAWLCKKGTATLRVYMVKGWSVLEPQKHEIKIELYRVYSGENSTKFYLEDTVYSNIAIIMVLPLQHIYVFSYFAAYLIACFLLLTVYYISELAPE